MNNDSSSNSVNTLLGFLAGAVLGGVVVALTTPKRGTDLRKDLNRLGGKAKAQLGEWAESASKAMKGGTPTGMENTDQVTRPFKAKAEEWTDKGQSAWKEIKKGAASGGNEVKDGLSAAAKELHA